MPLYMDIHHHVEGLTSEAVAGAHQRDLEVQTKYGVKYQRFGSTRQRVRYSAWSRHQTRRQRKQCTVRLTD
jgi:hypothetical protein